MSALRRHIYINNEYKKKYRHLQRVQRGTDEITVLNFYMPAANRLFQNRIGLSYNIVKSQYTTDFTTLLLKCTGLWQHITSKVSQTSKTSLEIFTTVETSNFIFNECGEGIVDASVSVAVYAVLKFIWNSVTQHDFNKMDNFHGIPMNEGIFYFVQSLKTSHNPNE